MLYDRTLRVIRYFAEVDDDFWDDELEGGRGKRRRGLGGRRVDRDELLARYKLLQIQDRSGLLVTIKKRIK